MSEDFQTVAAVFRDFSGAVCYARLSSEMQRALYSRFRFGYEEAFRAGLAWLRGNRED